MTGLVFYLSIGSDAGNNLCIMHERAMSTVVFLYKLRVGVTMWKDNSFQFRRDYIRFHMSRRYEFMIMCRL